MPADNPDAILKVGEISAIPGVSNVTVYRIIAQNAAATGTGNTLSAINVNGTYSVREDVFRAWLTGLGLADLLPDIADRPFGQLRCQVLGHQGIWDRGRDRDTLLGFVSKVLGSSFTSQICGYCKPFTVNSVTSNTAVISVARIEINRVALIGNLRALHSSDNDDIARDNAANLAHNEARRADR